MHKQAVSKCYYHTTEFANVAPCRFRMLTWRPLELWSESRNTSRHSYINRLLTNAKAERRAFNFSVVLPIRLSDVRPGRRTFSQTRRRHVRWQQSALGSHFRISGTSRQESRSRYWLIDWRCNVSQAASKRLSVAPRVLHIYIHTVSRLRERERAAAIVAEVALTPSNGSVISVVGRDGTRPECAYSRIARGHTQSSALSPLRSSAAAHLLRLDSNWWRAAHHIASYRFDGEAADGVGRAHCILLCTVCAPIWASHTRGVPIMCRSIRAIFSHLFSQILFVSALRFTRYSGSAVHSRNVLHCMYSTQSRTAHSEYRY